MRVPRHRRTILLAALAVMASGFAAGCGVKGPLYLPEEEEEGEKKDKDKEKSSRRAGPVSVARLDG